MKILLAIILGGAFGFVLQRAGATNPVNIIRMLSLKDFTIMKMILAALALASAAVFAIGAIDPEWVNLSVKPAHLGVIVGGLIFGVGFAIAGYCPGTSVCAVGEGRTDAVAFIVGGLFGALAFMLIYSSIQDTTLLAPLGAGKITVADTGVDNYAALVSSVPSLLVALLFAAILGMLAFALPSARRGGSA